MGPNLGKSKLMQILYGEFEKFYFEQKTSCMKFGLVGVSHNFHDPLLVVVDFPPCLVDSQS